VVANGGFGGAREWFRSAGTLTPGVHETVFGPWPNGASIAAEAREVRVVGPGPPELPRPVGPRRRRGPPSPGR
jgi:hypothetical protein